MGFFSYLKSRVWFFVPFLLVFAAIQGFRTHDWATAAGAFLIAAAFFALVFTVLGLLRAVIGRKPSRQLSRLR